MKVFNTASGMSFLLLGRLGENERTQFIFDVADWLEEYPDATIGLYNQLPHSNESYPVVISTPEDGKVTWTVADTELQEEGYGKCELVALKGDTVVKGHIWKTRILEALDGEGDVPDPWESWLTEFTALKGAAEDAAEDAEDARDAIEDMTVSSSTLPAGESATVTKTVDETTGAVNLAFGIPRGPSGNESIDDTAGAGDTDRVWSANKNVTELALKADKANPVMTGTLSKGRKANTTAGAQSSALGHDVEASGNYSFGEGYQTIASGNYSHSEGMNTKASNTAGHAEGQSAWATGTDAHAENYFTLASGNHSHAEGYYTEAKGSYQHVSGKANVIDNSSAYAEIIGNGADISNRSNARTLDWSGNERLKGDLYVGCNADSTGGTKVAKITDVPTVATTTETQAIITEYAG